MSNEQFGINQQSSSPLQTNEEKQRQKRFQEIVSFIKTKGINQILTLNLYVDVFDNFNSWRNGYILDLMKDDYVKIRFDGWSSKYDETHKVNSSKVAFFRSHAEPYTGGNRSAIRDFQFDQAIDGINKLKERLELLKICKFQEIAPSDVCQLLRGELYFMMDSILQENNSFKDDEVKASVDFMESFLRFMIEWFDYLTTTNVILDYIDGKAAHAQIYYFDLNVGMVSCFPEFFDLLTSVFYGGQPRTKKFFQNNEIQLYKLPQTAGQFAYQPQAREKGQFNQQVQSFVNYFGNEGGFDRLEQFLRWQSIDQESGIVKHRLPFQIIKSILPIIEALSKLLSPAFRQEYLLKLKDILFQRLQNLTLNDLKETQLNTLFLILKQIPITFSTLSHICQETECLEVRLALIFIKSNILEKKVKGVKELTDIVEKTTKSFNFGRNEDNYRVNFFNETSLSQFFEEEHVFDILLNEASHPEVFRRAATLFKFMAEKNGFTTDQLDQLWNQSQNKHENESKAVLDIIAEMAKVLPIDALDFLYEKILLIQLENYDSLLLMYIKDFTNNAVLNLQNQVNKSQRGFNKQKQILKYELYGLPLLWELILDTSNLSPTLMSPAIMSFINTIKAFHMKSEKEKYIVQCIDNLKRGVSVPQSLLIAQHCIDSFGMGQNWRSDSAEDILGKIVKEVNLVELVVFDLEKYVKSKQGVVITDPQTQILSGKIDHDHNIVYRLEFLEYINSVLPKKTELGLESFKKLWQCLILQPLHENDKTHLLDILIKSCSFSTKNALIRENQIEEIFKTTFSDQQLMPKLSQSLYKSIEKYFTFINQKNQSIIQQKQLIKVCKFDHIVGLEFFWSVVQYCPNEEIITQARQTLVNVHLRTEKLSQVDQRLYMWQYFLTRCKDVLRTVADSKAKGNIIRCLKSLVQGLEGKMYYTGTESGTQKTKFTVQIGKDEKTLRTFELPSNYTLLKVRKILNQEYKLDIQDYELYFQNYDVKLAPESEEDYSISQVEEARDREKTDIIIQGLSSSPFPGFLSYQKFRIQLANNWDIAEILFELLQSADEIYFDDIWEVLTLLPQNKAIKQQIERLQTDQSEEGWNKILHFTCSRKLLYCLQIIEGIIEGKDKEKERWSNDFIKSKGMFWLLKYYSRLDIADFSVIFNLKVFSSLSKILVFFLKNFLPLVQHFDYLQQPAQTSSNERSITLQYDISFRSLNFLITFFQKAENKHYNDSSTITDFISSTMSLVNCTIQANTNVWASLSKRDIFSKLIQKGLIEFQDKPSRKELQTQLISLCQINPDLLKPIAAYLLQILSVQFDKSMIMNMKDNVIEFLDLLSGILLLGKDGMQQIAFTPLLTEIIKECAQREDYEPVLGACFRVLAGSMQASLAAKEQILGNVELAECMIRDCLFQLPQLDEGGKGIIVARCQQVESRKEGYNLLIQMLSNTSTMELLLIVLQNYINQAFWRTNSYQNWNISQQSQQKSRTGFVGLKNLGCICYMNSLMQQLFTLPNFRESILQVPLEPKPQSVLYQFQILLSALKSSQKQFYDPRPICNVLGQDCSPINVLEQMDVDEFWSGFMDKLENELKPLRKELIIKRNFGGLLSNELICKGCPHQSSRDELFLALPLQVKNKKNILESLQMMTEGEMLEGDNAYFCEKCEKKIPTLMRMCVKKLPNILLLVLKRFEFNYETQSKYKLNDFYEFSPKLDMKQFTREYLKTQEYKKQQEQNEQSEDENASPNDIPEYPPEYYDYSLRGVIIHMGTADSGHYYSLIKDSHTNQWFEFNDTIVKPFDFADLPAEAFGSDEKGNKQNVSGGGMIKERSRNAYMVFYERNVYCDDNGKPLKNENEVKWYFNKVGDPEQQLKDDDPALNYNKEILQDNIKYQVSKVLFEKSFYEFSYNLLEQAINNQNVIQSTQIGKYCLQFFLMVVVRSVDRKELPKYLKQLKILVKNNYELASSLVNSFCSRDIVQELLVQVSIQDMKYIVAGLLAAAINCVAQHVDKVVSYNQFKKDSANAKLSIALMQFLWEFRLESRKCDQFFRILQVLSVSSSNCKFYLLRHKAIGRILLYFLEEPPRGAGYQDLRLLVSQYEKYNELLKLNKQILDNETVTVPQQNPQIWEISTHNYTYLIQTLTELFYTLGINRQQSLPQRQSLSQVENNNTYIHILDDDEFALLEDPIVFQRLLSLAYTRKARRSLSLLMQQLVKTPPDQNNIDPWAITERLVNAIYLQIKDCDEREVRASLMSLAAIASVKDAFEDQRCLLVAEVFILTLKDGLNYWIYTEIVFDYILKACSFNQKLLMGIHQVLSNNKSVLKLIENWIKESQNPYNHFQQQRWKVFKKKGSSLQSMEITNSNNKLLITNVDLKMFQQKAAYRNDQLFKRIMKQELPDQPSFDSDEELPHNYLEIDNMVDAIFPIRPISSLCYDFTNYQTWQIVESMDEMIELKPLPNENGKQTQASHQNFITIEQSLINGYILMMILLHCLRKRQESIRTIQTLQNDSQTQKNIQQKN